MCIRDRDCAVTLSIGEKKKASYLAFFNAGADRYLLRHETADKKHYERLHPDDMSFENRKRCLYDLKEMCIRDSNKGVKGTSVISKSFYGMDDRTFRVRKIYPC